MNIRIWSDLHLEFAPFRPQIKGLSSADTIVLAGDIGISVQGICWARTSFPENRVVYVAGNHEYYFGEWNQTLDFMRDAARTYEIDFLENDQVEIDGVRFVGCSLWVDFDYFDAEGRATAMCDYERGLSDAERIAVFLLSRRNPVKSRKLKADDVLQRHQQSRAWLTQALATQHPRTVVVTHHAPSIRSVAPRYLEDELTPGFASHLPEDLISSADLWVHGHMHDSADYLVAGANSRSARVICNPRGYPTLGGAFENEHFNPDLAVEVWSMVSDPPLVRKR